MKHALVIMLGIAGPALTEGLPLNPAVTQATIRETIWVPRWTTAIRPPFKFTNAIKLAKLRERGLTEADKSRFELDHRVPLALGGSPDDPRNLELQPGGEAEDKDAVESCLVHAVCAGCLTLDEARWRIWRDWRAAATACQ